MRKTLVLALLTILPLGVFAARLTLRDGTVVYGNFISGTQNNIIFQDQDGVRRRFDTREIRNLDFDAVSSSYNDRVYNNQRYGAANREYPTDRYGHTIAAGTEISVRTNEAIQADTASEGRTYSAVIQQDVRDSAGNLAVPRGSDAQLVVRNVRPGGTLSAGSL